MTRLVSIPDIPDGLPDGVAEAMDAIKSNLELLVGGPADEDKTDQAVRYGEVKVADAKPLTAVSLGGAPTAADYNKLLADVTELRTRYNYLVALLRGEKVGA